MRKKSSDRSRNVDQDQSIKKRKKRLTKRILEETEADEEMEEYLENTYGVH